MPHANEVENSIPGSPIAAARVMNQRPKLPWGSVSMMATVLPICDRATARFAASVVLPLPPFCWAMVIAMPAMPAPVFLTHDS